MKHHIKLAGVLGALATLGGCAAALPVALGAGSLGAVNALGNQGASAADEVSRMNCTQLRAEYERTKGFSINPSNGVRHAVALDTMREKGCRVPS